ncbi:hypothetical protein VNO80_04544 [Phaseolus coccineus]|uniref:Uncharacterized protein n=1 Tax=Phaseolus coccineus TaxID=3886 RepID=A0AAN9NTZ0_PHACN
MLIQTQHPPTHSFVLSLHYSVKRDNVLSLTLTTLNQSLAVWFCTVVTLVYFHSLNFFLQNPFFHSLEVRSSRPFSSP